jgi:hypothetical protein
MAGKFGADIDIVYVAGVGHYYNTLDMPVAGSNTLRPRS